MKTIKYLTILILVFLAMSCSEIISEAELNKAFINKEDYISIYSYISPQDTYLKARVFRAVHASNRQRVANQTAENLVIKTAKVVIADEEGNTIALPYVEDKEYSYKIAIGDFKIQPTKKYYLTVQVAGKTYMSSCVIPKNKVDASTVFYKPTEGFDINVTGNTSTSTEETDFFKKDITTSETFIYKGVTINVGFRNIQDDTNYYIVGATLVQPDEAEEKRYRNINFGDDRYRLVNKTDQDVNSYSNLSALEYSKSENIDIKVANVDKVMYEAFYTQHQNYYESGDFTGGNPAVTKSNITGEKVYGVFGGFQITTITKEKKEVVAD